MPPGATPTRGALPRRFGDFPTLPDALDYAADGETGLNFYNGKGVPEKTIISDKEYTAENAQAELANAY